MNIKKLNEELNKILNEEWTYADGSGIVTLNIPTDVIDSICTPGSNDLAVEEACSGVLRSQLDEISTEDINRSFNEIGFDMTPEERNSLSRQEKEHYLVRDAAWNAFEDWDREIDESTPTAKRNLKRNNFFKHESEEKRDVLKIKFVGVDDWNRPAFKPVDKFKKYFLTDVNNLFDEDATEEEIKKFYADKKPLRNYITYHGYSLDDDPHGGKIKFDLEIV